MSLLSGLTFSAVGCYTFRPGLDLDPESFAGLRRSAHPIMLVLSPDYEEYVSRDRGHPLADAQIYRIGEELATLTRQYFGEAFPGIAVVEESGLSAAATEGRFIVWPQVSSFDNTLTMFPTTQTLEIRLRAQIASHDGTTIGWAEGHGSSRHRIHLTQVDEERIGGLLSIVIQRALRELTDGTVQRIQEVAGEDPRSGAVRHDAVGLDP